MSSRRRIRVGIIAEDDSDVDAARVMIHRIARRDNIGIKRFVGKGCGRIKRKSKAWAANLKAKGCRYLVLIHDRDRQDLATLHRDLKAAVSPSPIEPFLICIPVEEMEAWWLADPNAIRMALHLEKAPKVKGHPQTIRSPKELIARTVKQCSNNRVLYLNTEHNVRIAEHLDFEKAKRCDSFLPFYTFVETYMT